MLCILCHVIDHDALACCIRSCVPAQYFVPSDPKLTACLVVVHVRYIKFRLYTCSPSGARMP